MDVCGISDSGVEEKVGGAELGLFTVAAGCTGRGLQDTDWKQLWRLYGCNVREKGNKCYGLAMSRILVARLTRSREL